MIVLLTFISKFIAVVCFSVLISFFSLFFDMIIQPGMIFHFYLNGLARYFGRKNKDYAVIEKMPKADRFQHHFEYCFENRFLFKMLGGCMPCSNVWHSLILSSILFFFVHHIFAWYWILAVVFISSFYLRYLMTKV